MHHVLFVILLLVLLTFSGGEYYGNRQGYYGQRAAYGGIGARMGRYTLE